MYFLSEKMKSMLQNKQSDQFDTLRQTQLWSVVFVVNAFFQIPSSAWWKEVENEEKNIHGLQNNLKQM